MKINNFAMYTIKYEKDGQDVKFSTFYYCDLSNLKYDKIETAVKCMIAGYLSDGESFDYTVNNVQLYKNEKVLYKVPSLSINNNDLKGEFYKLQFSINSTRHFFCDFLVKEKDLSNDEFLKDYCGDLFSTYLEINNLSKEAQNKPIHLKLSHNGKIIGLGGTIKEFNLSDKKGPYFSQIYIDDDLS